MAILTMIVTSTGMLCSVPGRSIGNFSILEITFSEADCTVTTNVSLIDPPSGVEAVQSVGSVTRSSSFDSRFGTVTINVGLTGLSSGGDVHSVGVANCSATLQSFPE